MNHDEFRKIVSLAIDREAESFAFYRAIADKTGDSTLRYLFNVLAEDEAKHRRTMEDFAGKPPDRMYFLASKGYRILDTFPVPPLTVDLKPVDGLVIAIRRELEAIQMYTQLANASREEGQKAVFIELLSMERGHKNRLEDIYVNMAFPEAW